MKRALFLIPLETRFLTGLIIGLLILPSLARADDFVLSGYTEAGKKSTAEDYEEEDTDNDYTYRNYHLKFGQKVSDG
ncbi:MAG: hypothetical protein KKH29_01885 [Candidatus Omnitrophica bacterium]|nr:hypothetical protein [Candidatus Omnitrophota bacterium]MBU4473016.1 hypothetical protein [Candidatus Omnitrophota bacterium]MCG2706139.1 hypothetical protein [Candidatus Omnitrophota bacterium]